MVFWIHVFGFISHSLVSSLLCLSEVCFLLLFLSCNSIHSFLWFSDQPRSDLKNGRWLYSELLFTILGSSLSSLVSHLALNTVFYFCLRATTSVGEGRVSDVVYIQTREYSGSFSVYLRFVSTLGVFNLFRIYSFEKDFSVLKNIATKSITAVLCAYSYQTIDFAC